jgi:hypothetical protein
MAVDVRPLTITDDALLLDAIRDEASPDYQARIPEATQAGLQATLRELNEYRPLKNEALNALVNKIGLTLIRNKSWTNPLALLKRGMLGPGNTIEEIQTGLIKARNFDPDREESSQELFGKHPMEVQANFHQINRQDRYPMTVNPTLLDRAFTEGSTLLEFLNDLMSVPNTSDQWDEFLLTCRLFAEYEGNGGFFKIKVPDVINPNSTADDARGALRIIRGAAGKLKFLSRRYNAAKMPVAATLDELVIFCSPEFNAAIDVEALAAAFNIDRAKMGARVIEIPQEEFGIDGVQAIMTTTDFFIIADKIFETTSQYNPATLHNNYWLHHHQIISASRFAPAILFTTQTADVIELVAPTVTGVSSLTALDRNGGTVTTVNRGEIYSLSATVAGTGDNGALRYELTGASSQSTYVTLSGVLHIGANETATSIQVKAISTLVTPGEPMLDGASTTATFTVAGDSSSNWPTTGHITGITVKGVAVANFAEGTHTYTVAVPGGTVTKSDVVVTGSAADHVAISVSGGNTVTIKAEELPGDPVYTINVTAA